MNDTGPSRRDPVSDAIAIAEGNGGRRMRELIDSVFQANLANPLLDPGADAAHLEFDDRRLIMTTDGFTVQPLEFPGGNIGGLAVYGTVNDLAVSGAAPRYLSLGVIIEEGFERATLVRIAQGIGDAARHSGIAVVTGDTKVVPRGQGGGLYLTTTGIGVNVYGDRLGMSRIRGGDVVLVSGPIGDHGTAIMLAREQFGLRGELRSDLASIQPFADAVHGLPGVRFLRDPTRGGLATVLHEIIAATGCGIRVDEAAIPVRSEVRSVCDILGYDPMFLACEGRVVAVVSSEDAAAALRQWRALPGGDAAASIGELDQTAGGLVLRTMHGGERWIEELEDEPLPRIC